jgi:hypothetical protein
VWGFLLRVAVGGIAARGRRVPASRATPACPSARGRWSLTGQADTTSARSSIRVTRPVTGECTHHSPSFDQPFPTTTRCLTARKRERKPASTTIRRHPARAAARALRRGERSALAHRQMRRRRLAQQRAQREAPRAALQAQCGEERVKPGANAVDGFRIAPLFAQRAGAGGVMTQRTHHMTTCGTRRFQRGAGKTGA